MSVDSDITLPGESKAYREARNFLLEEEIKLRALTEQIAEMRRNLPPGGVIETDYVFTETSGQGGYGEVRFSNLFENSKSVLVIYSMMYGEDASDGCPICTAFLDGLNGDASHLQQQINLVVAAKASPEKLSSWSKARGWNNLRLLSTQENEFSSDYFGEKDGEHMPVINVFQKIDDEIRHHYLSEMLFDSAEREFDGKRIDPRHVDMMWSLWNVLDVTPAGRGENWYPQNRYP